MGGYIQGGDPATYYPELWRWFVNVYGVKSVIDVGCGEGHAIDYFSGLIEQNVTYRHVWGIDGVEQEHDGILQHDYSTGPWPYPREPDPDHPWMDDAGWEFDLAWSCEFVEHVEERYIPNFLATFACAKLVLMTHADPGQPGHHHVNCQTADYWRGVMAAAGYALDKSLTRWARSLASMSENPINHFARSGLAFVRS